MYQVNDYVSYAARGIFQIRDITKVKNENRRWNDWYVLYANKDGIETEVRTPVDNTAIRPIMTKSDIDRLINDMPLLSCVWIEDKRKREECFKEMLESGNLHKLAQLAKSIYVAKEKKAAVKKTISEKDKAIYQYAENLLFEEISFCYDMKKEDIASFIFQRIEES